MRKEIIKLFPFFKMIRNTMLLGENVMKITLEINLNQITQKHVAKKSTSTNFT